MNLLTDSGYLCGMRLKIKEEKWFQANFLMSFFSIFVKSVFYFVVFKAVFLNSEKVDADEITLYYIIINIVALSIATAQSVSCCHMEDINTGAIIPHLLRPCNYMIVNYLNNLAPVVVRLLFNFLLIFGASCLLGQAIQVFTIFLGFFSVLLGFTILYLIQAVIGCFSVWFHDITRFRDVVYSLLMLLGGRLIPSDLLFSGLKQFVYYTPLPYVYDVPVKIIMGSGYPTMMAVQIFWTVIFGAAYVFLFNCFVKHNIEFGG